MDNSKKFIKMCDKADLEWKPEIGMWLWDRRNECIVFIAAIEYNFKGCLKHSVNCLLLFKKDRWFQSICKENYLKEFHPIWQQDQLQEMISEASKAFYYQWNQFWKFLIDMDIVVDTFYPKFVLEEATWEQLWLAFVMYEKYKKIWDDEKEGWKMMKKK